MEDFTIDGSGYTTDTLAYDSNGNLTYDGTQCYTYDAWNRQMTVAHGYRDGDRGPSSTIHSGQAFTTCAYDAAGRRISKLTANTGSWDCSYSYYFSSEYQIIEERNGSDQPIKDHVWGLTYVDEAVQTRVNTTPTSTATWAAYYPLQDANYNVLGVTDASGVLAERYEYGAYGARQVFVSAGSNDAGCFAPNDASLKVVTGTSPSQVTQPYGLCEIGHQGLFHDEAATNICNRSRVFDLCLGIWCQQDPASYSAGINLYQYIHANPVNEVDPTGALPEDCDVSSGSMDFNWRLPKALEFPLGPAMKVRVKGGWALKIQYSGKTCGCRDCTGHWAHYGVHKQQLTVKFGFNTTFEGGFSFDWTILKMQARAELMVRGSIAGGGQGRGTAEYNDCTGHGTLSFKGGAEGSVSVGAFAGFTLDGLGGTIGGEFYVNASLSGSFPIVAVCDENSCHVHTQLTASGSITAGYKATFGKLSLSAEAGWTSKDFSTDFIDKEFPSPLRRLMTQ